MKSNHWKSRRGFIKSAAFGAAGIMIGMDAFGQTQNAIGAGNKIIRRQLGNTDIELPVVSFGVMEANNPGLLKAAMDFGYVHFDTAHVYQDGRNEAMLGEFLKDQKRSSFVLATKIIPDDVDRRSGVLGSGATKESIFRKLEISLKRLQMSYVDILYFHAVSLREVVLAPQMLEAFQELKRQGKARYIGISTHQNEAEMIQAAMDSRVYDIVLTAINFKHSKADLIRQKAAEAAKAGIGIVAMKTMAGAYIDRERTKPVNCSAALKWVMQDSNFHTSIPGITSFDQMIQNFSIMNDLNLTEKEKSDLDEARLVAGLYCDNCTHCVKQCKQQLPINEYMRAFMYAYGYQNQEKALSVLVDYGQRQNPCQGCYGCQVVCPKGLDVAGRITEVSRLLSVS